VCRHQKYAEFNKYFSWLANDLCWFLHTPLS
jgi:hypothetical protein